MQEYRVHYKCGTEGERLYSDVLAASRQDAPLAVKSCPVLDADIVILEVEMIVDGTAYPTWDRL